MVRKLSPRCHQAGSLSATILGDRRWFDDGPPQWVEGRGKSWQRPCRSAAEAAELRQTAIRRLRSCGKRYADAADLAEELACCSVREPCCSGACPRCGRALQRWWVSRAKRLIRRTLRETSLHMVTLVPDFGQCPLADLPSFNPAAVKLKATRLLKAAGVSLAVGGPDFSVNIDEPGAAAYLQMHFTLFTDARRAARSRCLLNATNPSGSVKRPVVVAPFDGRTAGLAYAMKYEFFRRETYQQTPLSRADGRKTQNSRYRPLQGAAWVQLGLLLDRIGLDSRLMLIGVKRVKKYGEVQMRLIK